MGTCQVEIFEGKHGRCVVLVAGRILIGGQEGKVESNIRACAGDEAIDGANNALVDLGATPAEGVVGGGEVESIGMPEPWGVMLGIGFILSTPNR